MNAAALTGNTPLPGQRREATLFSARNQLPGLERHPLAVDSQTLIAGSALNFEPDFSKFK